MPYKNYISQIDDITLRHRLIYVADSTWWEKTYCIQG